MRLIVSVCVAGLIGITGVNPHPAMAQHFDHAVLDTVLVRYVAGGRVDYAALQAERLILDRYLAQVAAVEADEFARWGRPDQIAYLINAYNAYMLETVIDHYPIKGGGLFKGLFHPKNSVRRIKGVFDGIVHRAAGEDLTLDDIEHGLLRAEYKEPRIHLALVCAAMSCPPLREEAYTGDRLGEQFADQAHRFFNDPRHNRIEVARGRVRLSKIFDWFGEDFVVFVPERGYRGSDQVRGVLAFVAQYVPPRFAEFLESGEYRVEFEDYDWTLNDQAIAAASR